MKKSKGDVLVNQPGPKPGKTTAIPQRSSISEGFSSLPAERRTNMQQKQVKTGRNYIPGFNSDR